MACINCGPAARIPGPETLSAAILISFAGKGNFFIFSGRCAFEAIRVVIHSLLGKHCF
jgi:hypothetical protein